MTFLKASTAIMKVGIFKKFELIDNESKNPDKL